MTRKEAEQFLPLIQAYADGKTIQYNAASSESRRECWIDLAQPAWQYPPSAYRIKPEKKKGWIAIQKNSGRASATVYTNRDDALAHFGTMTAACLPIEYEEGQGL